MRSMSAATMSHAIASARLKPVMRMIARNPGRDVGVEVSENVLEAAFNVEASTVGLRERITSVHIVGPGAATTPT